MKTLHYHYASPPCATLLQSLTHIYRETLCRDVHRFRSASASIRRKVMKCLRIAGQRGRQISWVLANLSFAENHNGKSGMKIWKLKLNSQKKAFILAWFGFWPIRKTVNTQNGRWKYICWTQAMAVDGCLSSFLIVWSNNNNTYASTNISPNSKIPNPYISLPSCLLSGQLANLFPGCHLYLLLYYAVVE